MLGKSGLEMWRHMKANDNLAIACGVLAAFLWATISSVYKLTLRELDVRQLTFVSVVCATLVLFLILVANLTYLMPFFAFGFIALFVGETILPTTIAGMGLILAGMFLQRRRPAPGWGEKVA